MTGTTTDLWTEWQRVAARAVREQVELGRRTWQSARDLSGAEPERVAGSGRSYLQASLQESGRYWRDAISLGLDYADAMLTLSQRSVGRVLDRVDAVPEATDGGSEARRVPLVMTGAVGSTATAKVTVANRQHRTRRVSLVASDLTGPAGTFTPRLELDPPAVLLQAGEEREVTLRLPLDPGSFVAGESYSGEVHLRGGDDAVLELEIRVL